MSENTLTITDNRTGKQYQLPIEHGTIRAMDLRQIKVSDDDFEKARVPATQTYAVRAFVPGQEIEDLYFDHPYYLAPSGAAGAKAYALLRDAMGAPLFEAFEDDTTLGDLGKPITLPDGVEVLSVQTDADPEPITAGEADLYFFPRGRTQLAAIQLKGKPKLSERVLGEEDIEYTILVQPLTGRVTVESGLVDLELPKVVDAGEDDLGEKAERRSF